MGHATHDHGASHAGGQAGGHGAGRTGPGGAGAGVLEQVAHGAAEPPSAPMERSISPAPEDFENLPGAGAMLWPLVWIGLAALLLGLLLKRGWPAFDDKDHASHAPAASGH